MHDNLLAKSQLPGGAHHWLSQLVGEWQGTTRLWLEPGVLADESPQQGTIRPLLDGRFLLHEYTGAVEGEPLQGAVILGYNLARGQFETAWVDTWHMGTIIMLSVGAEAADRLSVLGSYEAPEGPPWGWRTKITVQDADHITITAYNISPEGQEAKAVETVYTRLSKQ